MAVLNLGFPAAFVTGTNYVSAWAARYYSPAPPAAIGHNVGAVLASSSLGPVYAPDLLVVPGQGSSHSSSSSSTVTISLVRDGCPVPNAAGSYPRTVDNCTVACADPQYALAGATSMWNCATLASVDLLVRNGSLTLDAPDAARRAGVSGFNASATIEAFATCASAACQQRKGRSRGGLACSAELAGEIAGVAPALRAGDPGAAIQGLRAVLDTYCDGASSREAASDVAAVGPGVIISCIIQSVLALVLFFSLKLISWSRLAAFPVLAWRARRPRSHSATQLPGSASAAGAAWSTATAVRTHLSGSRATAALLAAALDFHEVQLWFVIAIQSAALVINAHAAAANTPPPPSSSYAAILAASDLTTTLACSAFLPCLVVEIFLRRATSRASLRPTARSWVLLVLTTATWCLAVAVLVTQDSALVDFEAIAAQLKHAYPLAACGGNPGPEVLCGLERLPDFSSGGLQPLIYAIGVGYPVVPSLWVQQVAWAVACRGRSDEVLRQKGFYGIGIAGRLRGEKPSSASPARRRARLVWIGILEFVWALFQGTLLVFLVIYLVALFALLDYTGTSPSQWTFGQLVAVAIWVPTVVRYLYANIFGTQETPNAIAATQDYQGIHREKGDTTIPGAEDRSPFEDPTQTFAQTGYRQAYTDEEEDVPSTHASPLGGRPAIPTKMSLSTYG